MRAVFICDVLDVEPGDASARAAVLQEGLITALQRVSPGVELTTRTLSTQLTGSSYLRVG